LRRIIIALDRSDLAKLPFSDDVTSDSRLLMRRNLSDRVTTLAPFLTYDPDPYIVLGDDGRLSWIMDGFTVSDSYPYSNSLPSRHDSINYMRNSVRWSLTPTTARLRFTSLTTKTQLLLPTGAYFQSVQRCVHHAAGLRSTCAIPNCYSSCRPMCTVFIT